MPDKLPPSLTAAIASLKRTSSPEKCLRRAYDVLTAKYHGSRLKTVTRFWQLLPHSAQALWNKNGFLHCTHINRLLVALLLGSGKFCKADLARKWTLLWYVSPHQYMRVRVAPRRWIDIDIWANAYGIAFGDHAHGFHVRGRQ